MFSITVAMIVKDEELTLDRILTCVQKFADEIIIVDTGSKDTSKSIAYKYTDKVYDYEWCDDFAKARNFAFSLASKDYIMWLDADDYISNENIQKIISLKTHNDKSIDVYMLKYAIGDNFSFYRERILKREKHFQWVGAVHEVIPPSGKIEYKDIIIEHKKEKENKPKRNLKIYNKLINNKIQLTPREQYYYARELYYNGYYKKCISTLNKYLKANDNYLPNILGAYIILADACSQLKDYAHATHYLLESMKTFTPSPEVCSKLADALEKDNKIELAIYWYETALLCPKQTQGFVNTDYDTFIPAIELCRLYYPKSKSKAKEFYEIAKRAKPLHPSIIYNEKFFK